MTKIAILCVSLHSHIGCKRNLVNAGALIPSLSVWDQRHYAWPALLLGSPQTRLYR